MIRQLKFSKLLMTTVLVISIFVSAAISVAAYTEDQPEFYQERMDKIHWVADALRSLGWENGTDTQKAALAQCGAYWHEQNSLKKEVIARKQEEAQNQQETLESLGTWKITAYCNDPQSASGMANIVGQTCACNCLPFGSVIRVEGMGDYVVTDHGASSGSWAWHNSNWADLYMGSASECNSWGVQSRQVWLVK